MHVSHLQLSMSFPRRLVNKKNKKNNENHNHWLVQDRIISKLWGRHYTVSTHDNISNSWLWKQRKLWLLDHKISFYWTFGVLHVPIRLGKIMPNEHFHYNSHSWFFSCELLLLSSKEPCLYADSHFSSLPATGQRKGAWEKLGSDVSWYLTDRRKHNGGMEEDIWPVPGPVMNQKKPTDDDHCSNASVSPEGTNLLWGLFFEAGTCEQNS